MTAHKDSAEDCIAYAALKAEALERTSTDERRPVRKDIGMKRIQKFQADDGAEFTTEAACLEYEALCAEIADVMATLPQRPDDDGCRFYNGHCYLQHTPERFWPARDALLRIGNRLMPHKWFEQALADKTVHPSWCGRLIDETIRPLSRAWVRVMCVDNELREWGQPYYANNPDKVPLQSAKPIA